VGKAYVEKTSKIADLQTWVHAKMRWPSITPLVFYEEIKPGMIDALKPQMTFQRSEIQDGDIVCFQVQISEKEAHDLEGQGLYATPTAFYEFIQNRVLIEFRPKQEDADERENPRFELVLSKKQTYDHMAAKVADHLHHEFLKLRFTTTHPTTQQPKSVLKRALNQSISEIISPSYGHPTPTVILYERLNVSIVELETKRSLKIAWTGIHNKEEASYNFLLPKTSNVNDLTEQLAKKVTLVGSRKIRIFEVANTGKMQKDCNGGEMIGNIPEQTDLFAEEVPEEELQASEQDKIINVFHYTKEVSRTHGVPFRFVLKPGEKFSETKKRLIARLGVSETLFLKHYKVCLIQVATFKQPSQIEDNDIIYDHKFAPEDCLGIDHPDKSGKRTGAPAIFIKG